MTTEKALKAELARQTARYLLTNDPILKTSIVDLVETLKRYPEKLVWMAEQAPEPPPGA